MRGGTCGSSPRASSRKLPLAHLLGEAANGILNRFATRLQVNVEGRQLEAQKCEDVSNVELALRDLLSYQLCLKDVLTKLGHVADGALFQSDGMEGVLKETKATLRASLDTALCALELTCASQCGPGLACCRDLEGSCDC